MANVCEEVQEQAARDLQDGQASAAKRIYAPRVDVYETNEAVVLLADMPGIDDKTLDITLDRDMLTIKGSVDADGVKGHSACCSEYGVGDYERTFRIGDVIDHEHISATIKDGVLSLTLPKIDRAQIKKIAINAIQ